MHRQVKKRKAHIMRILLTALSFLLVCSNAQGIYLHSNAIISDDSTTVKSLPCNKMECSVYIIVNKANQRLYVFLDGALLDTFDVSTGMRGHVTPNMEHRFNGRMYKKYTSKKFPGGDYMGLGNMPYAMFVRGGYAIHGTTLGNIKYLGRPASHGCIRLHPDNAKLLYELVEKAGVENTWVSIL